LAAQFGKAKTCALLIENGADMDIINDNGKTASMLAALSNDNEKTAKFLKSMEDIQQLMDKEGFKELMSNFRECAQ
jgi:ankyrin repeat protein